MFVEGIDGIFGDNVNFVYWGFWIWNSTSSSWEMASTGPSSVNASSLSAFAWFYTSSWTVGPMATPEHRYPWASFRHDSLNTGAQLNASVTNMGLLWERDLGNGAIDASVVGANGLIYVITGGILNQTTWAYDTNSKIFCLNKTGTVWSAEIGTGFQVASPLLFRDKVYVPSADGKLYAFYAQNGTLAWAFDTHSAENFGIGITSSPIAYQNYIIFADGNGRVYALREDGSQYWNMTIANRIYSSSPAVNNGMIYIGGDDGKLHAITADGDEEEWNITIGSKVRGSPILMGDKIVVSYLIYNGSSPMSGGLAAVDYDGVLLWNTSTDVSPASPALTDKGFVVMTSSGMSFIDFDGADPWSISLSTSFAGAAPTAVDGMAFAVTNEASSRVVAINETGNISWQQTLSPSQYALSAPTIIDGILYVTSDNGKVYAYSLDAGAPITPTTSDIPMWAWIVAIIAVVSLAGVGIFMARRKK
jgi:outer membrane protein assembly factor BamB